MAGAERVDPYLGFRFQVEIDSLIVAGFAEVSGLEVQMTPEEYEEGGVNTYTHQFPTRFTHSNLELRRGLADYSGLWEWIEEVELALSVPGILTSPELPIPTVLDADHRRNVRVLLLDSSGSRSWGWEFRDAYPVRWSGPELQADQGTVAMETLELAHRGVSKMDGLP